MGLFPRSWTKRKTQLRRYVPHYEKHEPVGVYMHIPFCAKKCPYCDFYSLATAPSERSERLMDDFTAAMVRGVSDCAAIHTDIDVDTVYFGGGTPGYLGAKRLTDMLRAIKSGFHVRSDAEITFEANPAVTDIKSLKALKKGGFNRVSIGVQSFLDSELQALGRLHNAETAAAFIESCRAANFQNISIDLMYGIPGQTMDSWLRSLEHAVSSRVTHISFYSLKLEEGTPFYAAPPPMLPDDDTSADMYLAGVELLRRAGFEQYEISNFARNGMVARHNLRYWHCRQYLGFGPGAHSYFSNLRYSYVRDLPKYLSIMNGGSGSLIDGDPEEILPRERLGEYVMLGLRLSEGLDESYFTRNFLRDFTPVGDVLKKYIPTGHVEKTDGGYRLTPKGFLVSNLIIGEALTAIENSAPKL